MRVPQDSWGITAPGDWPAVERIMSLFQGVAALGFGCVILMGGAVRFPPPTYAPLLTLTRGQVWPYAVLFLVAGVLLVWGRTPVLKMVGYAFGILAYSAFAGLFLVAVIRYPDAGSTAWWAYALFAVQSASMAAFTWLFRKRADVGG